MESNKFHVGECYEKIWNVYVWLNSMLVDFEKEDSGNFRLKIVTVALDKCKSYLNGKQPGIEFVKYSRVLDPKMFVHMSKDKSGKMLFYIKI